MSQPSSSGRNTPTASGSHLPPTGGPAPTLTDLTRVVLDLGVAVGHITTQLNTLAQQVTLATSTRPQAAKVAVAGPKAWNGKGGSVEARHFLAAFANYAGNEGDSLNDWDALNCYVTVGTLSRLGIVSPIGNVALRVLVLGSK